MTYELFDRNKYDPEIVCRKNLKRLVRKFKVPTPILVFNTGRVVSNYRRRNDVITLSDLSDFDLLHEFAHHATIHIYRIKINHGKEFKRTLWKIVMWFYNGNPTLYPWDKEYINVKKYGSKRIAGLNKRRNQA